MTFLNLVILYECSMLAFYNLFLFGSKISKTYIFIHVKYICMLNILYKSNKTVFLPYNFFFYLSLRTSPIEIRWSVQNLHCEYYENHVEIVRYSLIFVYVNMPKVL